MDELVATCSCGQEVRAPAYMAGTRKKCGACGAAVPIGGVEAPEESGRRVERLAWEEPGTGFSVGVLASTVGGFLARPVRTFARVDLEAPQSRCLVYLLVLGSVFGWVGLAATWWFQIAVLNERPEPSEAIVRATTLPIAVALQAFSTAAIIQISLLVLGEGEGGFDSTFRVAGYAVGSTAILRMVPVVGDLVAMIWALVLTAIGLRECHTITPGKAVLVVLLPFVVFVGCAVACFAPKLR